MDVSAELANEGLRDGQPQTRAAGAGGVERRKQLGLLALQPGASILDRDLDPAADIPAASPGGGRKRWLARAPVGWAP